MVQVYKCHYAVLCVCVCVCVLGIFRETFCLLLALGYIKFKLWVNAGMSTNKKSS